MQKTIAVLAVLLAAQLLLALTMSFTGQNLASVQPDTPLLNLGDRLVDRLTIEDADSKQVVLTRQGEGWVLSETGIFPADNSKVDSLIDKIKGLKRGLAVATTEGAMRRFKVNQDAFERRVVFARGEESLATLYFGSSPSMRRVHARTSEDDAVYVVEFSIHDAPVKGEDWEDKTVLQIQPGEIEKIRVADTTLSRVSKNEAGAAVDDADQQVPEQANWTIEAMAEGETANQVKADALVDKLTGLRIGAVLGSEAKPEYGLENPELVIALQRRDGQEIEYQLGKRDQEKDYVLKASSRPEYFRLPSYAGDALVEAAKREQLVSMNPETIAEDELASGAVETQPTDSPSETVQKRATEKTVP